MKMGRSKLPDKIKQLRGTDQKCRMSNVDFGDLQKLPAPPKTFSKTSKRIYKTLGASALASGILTATNLPQFVAYCNEIGIYMDANDTFDTLESRVEAGGGMNGTRTFVSGMQRIADGALQKALKIGREFGFTPATVNRIGGKVKEDGDDFSKFLNS
jgi:P27 family predicted phage terminase small subunit